MYWGVAIVVAILAIYKYLNSTIDYTMSTAPVYFLSHGGPTFLYRNAKFGGEPGAFDATAALGKFIRETIQPKFVIMVSAHWQSDSKSSVQVAVPSGSSLENELIYDFYGFPKQLYAEKFRTRNDLSLATRITKDLNLYFSKDGNSPVHASLATRGIDHGVWVPLRVAFPAKTADDWNLDVPLVQVSLTADETDFVTHYKLGQALSKYRDEGGLVLVSGMSVHNLRDNIMSTKPLSYTTQFNELLRDILLPDVSASNKLNQFKDLLKNPAKRKLLYSAHPTLEHFVPMIVGLGAGAGQQTDGMVKVKEIYNKDQASLGWGIYQYDDN
ncbi:DODA-type extradiol aromatic ring-opening family dioxygenase TDEL_0B01850 [Torulaspora delbrueckii]|uniref:Extradiol ring-cleavage dioxygenase class III enzyme subunit B domain-containing protein n=1 Tax=Torulaspora delbrueckii TaxID=4950 RepID=G8ZNX0_TORDE|nr:hypothetical protein TDEL_0B01850 [Torulaspora delbrueckii]CCE90314.1 hypothetical protein TDEL_0B01850 [Torulaspora delbrueckii]